MSLMVKEMKIILDNMLSSYETSIQGIGSIFDTTYKLFEDFQDSFLNRREKQEKIHAELRESLARNESLRRKDFDSMMQGILSSQDERERDIKNLLKGYLNEQKGIAHTIRDNLAKVKDAHVRGEGERIKEFEGLIRDIFSEQEERKGKVISMLKDFQRDQQEIGKGLEDLLTKGRDLRIRDLKSMIKKFKLQQKERITRQGERRDEVISLLDKFKKERIETVRNWRAEQNKIARQRKVSRKT